MKQLVLDFINKIRLVAKAYRGADGTSEGIHAPPQPASETTEPAPADQTSFVSTQSIETTAEATAVALEPVATPESAMPSEFPTLAEPIAATAEPDPISEVPEAVLEATPNLETATYEQPPSPDLGEAAPMATELSPVHALRFAAEAGITLRELRAIFEGPDWSKLMRNARDGGATSILACRILDKTMALLQHGNKHVERMLDAAQNVRATTGQLASIAEDIKQVSNQTRIVSINAGIEANRAGVHGRTFQVVALQMTALSEDARNLTLSIDSKLHGVNDKININRELCSEVGKLFNDMNSELGEFRRMMMRVEELAEIQVEQLGQIEQIITEPATKKDAA